MEQWRLTTTQTADDSVFSAGLNCNLRGGVTNVHVSPDRLSLMMKLSVSFSCLISFNPKFARVHNVHYSHYLKSEAFVYFRLDVVQASITMN